MKETRIDAWARAPGLAGGLFALVLGLAACEGGGVRDPSLGMTGPTTSATFSSLQSTIFSSRCAFTGCHAGNPPAEGLDLSPGAAFANLVGVRSRQQPSFLRVNPGDAADSYLFMKLSGDSRIQREPMPLGLPPLTDAQLAALAMWIDGGAPNN